MEKITIGQSCHVANDPLNCNNMKMMRLGHIPTDDTNDMENIRPCNGHGDQTTNQLAMKSWI